MLASWYEFWKGETWMLSSSADSLVVAGVGEKQSTLDDRPEHVKLRSPLDVPAGA